MESSFWFAVPFTSVVPIATVVLRSVVSFSVCGTVHSHVCAADFFFALRTGRHGIV